LLLELGAVLVELGLIHKLQLFVGLFYCEQIGAIIAFFSFEELFEILFIVDE